MNFLLPQVCLLASFLLFQAASQPCHVRKDVERSCGCKPLTEAPVSSDDWAGSIGSRATREDAEYYYIDDMAFRKTPRTNNSGRQDDDDTGPFITPWAGNVVYYYIDMAFTSDYRKIILDAIDTLGSAVGKAHLEFIPVRSHNGKACLKSYMHIFKAQMKCVAEVGMYDERETSVWLDENICPKGVILHELLHVLGRFHEHERFDRDDYVTIDYNEIDSRFCDGFKRVPRVFADKDPAMKLPYDILSVLHYSSCTFNCRGNIVLSKKADGSPIDPDGTLTELDIKKLRLVLPAEKKLPPIKEDLCPKHLPGSGTSSIQFHFSTAGVVVGLLVVLTTRTFL